MLEYNLVSSPSTASTDSGSGDLIWGSFNAYFTGINQLAENCRHPAPDTGQFEPTLKWEWTDGEFSLNAYDGYLVTLVFTDEEFVSNVESQGPYEIPTGSGLLERLRGHKNNLLGLSSELRERIVMDGQSIYELTTPLQRDDLAN